MERETTRVLGLLLECKTIRKLGPLAKNEEWHGFGPFPEMGRRRAHDLLLERIGTRGLDSFPKKVERSGFDPFCSLEEPCV